MTDTQSNLDIVRSYLSHNYRIVTWPAVGDIKGPKEPGWPQKPYGIDDYHEGHRVGLLTGWEIEPGHFLHDVDIDWAPGSLIAQKLLPSTGFIFGRSSKRVSHCMYTLPVALPSERFEDIDKTCLIEWRGVKTNGDLGFQTMVPPSIWSKEGQREPLTFVRFDGPAFIDIPSVFKQRCCLSAIGMILAKHLGKNGFGHEPRLAWAGFLLRAGIPVDDLVAMGESMSAVTNNTEVHDVRRVVESTAARLSDPKQKIKGGPALAKFMGEKGKAVIARINEWLGRDSDFLRNPEGMVIKDSQENIRRAIALLEIELTYNEFAERSLATEAGGVPKAMNDEIHNGLWLRIDREHHFRPTKAFFDVVIEQFVYERKFHPVRDYLSSLTWDGTPRIDRWLESYSGSPDSEYHRAVSSLVLIAAVRRVRHPGCKFDEMLVLESSQQGLNKSSALRALCPDESWFSDDLPLNVDAKQIIERTLGKWIIEASDLVGGRKADRDHLKSMLSRQIDGPARLAYAHHPVERARQFIIIGTTNSVEYLADSTGARRFWPVTIKRFNVEGIVRDRDQLWAEAAVREARGDSIRLPEHLWKVAEGHQEDRRTIDAWESIIEMGLEENAPVMTNGRRQIPTDRIWDLLGIETSRRDRVGALRISEIMQRLGFYRTRVREEGKVVVGYVSDSARGKMLEFGDKE